MLFFFPLYLAVATWLLVGTVWLSRPGARSHCKLAVRWGFAIGSIAFALGYLLPIVLRPQSNQGPLLGVLCTGPLGFVVGAVVGFAIALSRDARRPSRNRGEEQEGLPDGDRGTGASDLQHVSPGDPN